MKIVGTVLTFYLFGSPGWPETYRVVQAGLELVAVFLNHSLECMNHHTQLGDMANILISQSLT